MVGGFAYDGNTVVTYATVTGDVSVVIIGAGKRSGVVAYATILVGC